MGKKIDMTNWNMWEHGVPDSRIHVIKQVGKKGGHLTWLCQCTCGNQFVTIGNYIRNGTTKSCGCLRKEKNYERFKIDIVGKTFGLLTVLEELPDRDKKGYIKYRCKCQCGNECIIQGQYLRNGDTNSCGCLSSMGERTIMDTLQQRGIDYKKEYTFKNLCSSRGARLRFDFAVFKNNELQCLIEYQGEQHYYGKSCFGALQRETTDQLKRNYCQEHNIPLFEIGYYENLEDKLNKILDNL